MSESDFNSVVPAQLSFLTIYNPRLGSTDETLRDQIVFYTSRSGRSRRHDSSDAAHKNGESNDDWNERLRQIGLAQGMVSFARNFSDGKAVDYVETDRSHIVLHELEANWWILASIDLTRLPADSSNNHNSSSNSEAPDAPSYNYSSREMCPPHLLIQQLRRAHSLFLLHHDFTLDALCDRVGRSAFCTLLDNFWWRYAWNWDVLLTGNPAVDIYDGIKLSAGGELGIGVGEEEWGSGERAVLEDIVARTDGLADLIVSRFGDPPAPDNMPTPEKHSGSKDQDGEGSRWLGSDTYPRPSDGIIFSGAGAVSRPSLVRVSQWMEWIYRYGLDAYGVSEDVTSPRRRKRRRRQRGRLSVRDTNTSAAGGNSHFASPDRGFYPGIPRPLVLGTSQPSQPVQDVEGKTDSRESGENSPSPARSDQSTNLMGFNTGTFVKYLTLGYGSAWGNPSEPLTQHPRVEALKREDGASSTSNQSISSPEMHETSKETASQTEDTRQPRKPGRFIIGPQACLNSTGDDVNLVDNPNNKPTEHKAQRTLYVHLATPSEKDTSDPTQLRVVVYVQQPFIYTFLFNPGTSTLTDPTFYQTLRHQLTPLQNPLCSSTSPEKAAARISVSESNIDISQRFASKNQDQDQLVYDLVYDPSNLTIRSSIPNIPDLGSSFTSEKTASADANSWPRIESLNIHHRLLSTYLETRARPLETERTCKTSRGWWIVWVRVSEPGETQSPDSGGIINTSDDTRQEAFLIRKASDHVSLSSAAHARNGSGTRFFRDLGGASLQARGASDTGPGKLVEGLGLDARRYIENLLSLNRS